MADVEVVSIYALMICLEWNVDSWLGTKLSLLLQLLVGSLNRDRKTDLCLLLCPVSMRLMIYVFRAYLEVIHLGGKGHLYWWSNTLLPQTAELSGRVDLCAEGRHAEVVLDTEVGDALLAGTAHHWVAAAESKLEINTGLNIVGNLSPVSSSQCTLCLKLSAGNPVQTPVLGAVRDGSLWALVEGSTLPHSLETKSERWGNGLEVAADEDAGNATIDNRRLNRLNRCGEVGTGILVIDLGHGLCLPWLDRHLRLGDELWRPAIVEAGVEGSIIIDVTLQEDLGHR